MATELRAKSDALFCLATGSTPMRSYAHLRDVNLSKGGLLRKVRVIKLDEWGGLKADDPASCEAYLQDTLIKPAGLGKRYIGFRGDAPDVQAEVNRVSRWLQRNGPIDVCVLGLGVNGHLAFNEPADSLHPEAHVANLTTESMAHTMLNQAQGRPFCGLTLGMADLLRSKKILLLVSGKSKQGPLRRLLKGRIETRFPATFLWLHPNVTLLCDQDAMSSQTGKA